MTHSRSEVVKIFQTESIVFTKEVCLVFAYKPNTNYRFTESFQCWNIKSKKQLPIVKQGGSYGFNINNGKFKSLTFVKSNIEKLPTGKPLITQESILQAICDVYEVSKAKMYTRNKMGRLGWAKKTWTYLLDKYIDNNDAVVAKMMKLKAASRIAERIEEHEGLMATNKAYENNFNVILDKLMNK